MSADHIKALTFIVKSPAGMLFERSGLRSVQLELRDGKIGIRTGHAPMVAEVSDGDAILDGGESVDRIALHAGIALVQDDVITIYTHALDGSTDLNAGNTVDDAEENFEDIYEAIVATLLSGTVKDENQNAS